MVAVVVGAVVVVVVVVVVVTSSGGGSSGGGSGGGGKSHYKKVFFLLSKIICVSKITASLYHHRFVGLQKNHCPTPHHHIAIVVNVAVTLFPASHLVPLPGLSSPFSANICFLLFSHAQ